MAGVLRIHRPAADVRATTVAALAMGKGVLHAPNYATADYSGWCDRDLVVEQMGYGHKRIGRGGVAAWESARILSTKVRCRKCEGCRKERRCMWTQRAAKEWRQSTRTWFVTLTLRPEDHYKLQTKVRQRVAAAGGNLDAMQPRERLEEMLKDYRREMDLYLMRLRKGLRERGWGLLRFRYLWVPEPHKSGAIHFHMLLHEVSSDMAIRKERIEGSWGRGFVSAKLVKSEDAARYVTKYLGKHHFEGRIRASKHYGEETDRADVQHVDVASEVQANRRPPHPLAEAEARQLAQDYLDLGMVPGQDEAEELRPGEEIGVCPTGAHFGVTCSCQVNASDQADPFGTESGDTLTPEGVPRRKWPLRGWHAPSHTRPSRRKTAAGEGVH